MKDKLLNNVLPNSYESEIAILSQIIWGNRNLIVLLNKDYFYNEACKIIFDYILKHQDKEINYFVLKEYFKDQPQIIDVLNQNFAYNIIPEGTTDYYLKRLKECEYRRRIINISSKLLENSYDLNKDIYKETIDLTSSIDIDNFNLDNRTYTSDELFNLALQSIPDAPKMSFGKTTGYEELDYITSGWEDGSLVIIAGRPGMGKTAFVLNSILRSSKKLKEEDGVYLFYSLEQSLLQLALRCVSIAIGRGISVLDLKRGTIGQEERKIISNVVEKLKKLPIIWKEGNNTNYYIFENYVKSIAKTRKLAGVVIDHMGQFTISSNPVYAFEDLNRISLNLQSLTRQLQVPIIALHQLNRDLEKRADKRPHLSDLRASGRIEEVAWVVLLLYRDEYYNPETEKKGILEVIVAKNKDGMLGTIELKFDASNLAIFQNY